MRYGDMLVEFYDGIRDGSLSEARLRELQDAFNRLGVSASKLDSWLSDADSDPHFGKVYARWLEFMDNKDGLKIGNPPYTYDGEEWSLVGVEDEVLQVGIRASDGKLLAGGGTVRLTENGIEMFNGSTQTGKIDDDGDLSIGSDISAAGTTSFNIFTNAQTYNGESVGAGDLLVGDNSSGSPNIFWDASEGELQFREGENIGAKAGSGELINGIGAEIYLSSSQSISNITNTVVNLDASVYDDADFWDSVTNPTRITIPQDGRYMFGIKTVWAASSAGARIYGLFKNGSTATYWSPTEFHAPINSVAIGYGTWELDSLSAGDYFELGVWQSSGGALNLAGATVQVRRTR